MTNQFVGNEVIVWMKNAVRRIFGDWFSGEGKYRNIFGEPPAKNFDNVGVNNGNEESHGPSSTANRDF